MSHWKLSSQCPQIVCQRCFWFVLGPLDRLPGFLRRLSIQLSFSHSRYAEEGICSHRRMGIQGEIAALTQSCTPPKDFKGHLWPDVNEWLEIMDRHTHSLVPDLSRLADKPPGSQHTSSWPSSVTRNCVTLDKSLLPPELVFFLGDGPVSSILV